MNPGGSSTASVRRGATAALLTLTSACGQAPSVNILGSFFPAWLICIVSGIALTMLVRQVLVAAKLAHYLQPAALVYPCLGFLLIFAIWLVVFGN